MVTKSKRIKLAKERDLIYAKYNGRCAYCGKKITAKKMQVDHIEPLLRGQKKSEEELSRLEHIDNKNPSCARCNRYKATYSLEQLRYQIGMQVKRLFKSSSQFRFAVDFELVEITNKPVQFYFETVQPKTLTENKNAKNYAAK